jgi:hypothetical protein
MRRKVWRDGHANASRNAADTAGFEDWPSVHQQLQCLQVATFSRHVLKKRDAAIQRSLFAVKGD